MMSMMPSVMVKKGGFLSALCYGVFGFLTVAVFCGSAVGIYAIHSVDKHASHILELGTSAIAGLPEWQAKLPPVISDALNDRRAPEYRDNLDVSVRMAKSSSRHGGKVAVIDVANNGDETVSVLALRVLFENEDGVPSWEDISYAATPLAIEDEWRGPLLPGSRVKYRLCYTTGDDDLTASVQIADVRVAQPAGAVQHPELVSAD